MTIAEAIEQAARAMFEKSAQFYQLSVNARGKPDWDGLRPEAQNQLRQEARAAIARFLECVEPSMDMRGAAVNVTLPEPGGPPLYEKIWRAMSRKLAEEVRG